MNTKIILIRHAESIKNTQKIHGGNGEPLTPHGMDQAHITANILLEWGVNCNNSVIIFPSNVQTVQTADIISSELKIDSHLIPDFKPLYLGIAHGLSDDEVKSNYPETYNLLTKWRKKEIEISNLLIPGMEAPQIFFERGQRVLHNIITNKHNIFIATSSLYILLANILLGNSYVVGGQYKHFDIPNCGISFFYKLQNGQYILDRDRTNVQDILSFSN